MGTLVLVRHGQAQDRLTATGAAQARKLGEYWTRHRIQFDEVLTGSLDRQRETAAVVGECYAAAGVPWPEPRENPAFNEYDAEGVVSKFAPRLAERDPAFRELWAERQANPGSNPHFQRMFEALMLAWQEGSPTAPGVEPWSAFRERVAAALHDIMQDSLRGRRVVVFTSGGVIGLAVALALGAPDRSALEANWRIRNCSLTEFRFRRDRLSLDSFNVLAHLDDPALITFR